MPFEWPVRCPGERARQKSDLSVVGDQLSLFDSRCQGLLAENAALARRGRRLDLRSVELARAADGHNTDLRNPRAGSVCWWATAPQS